jgi:putative ABC transport system ATP-binding protein
VSDARPIPPAVKVSAVRKDYEGGMVHALTGVDLEVAQGGFVAISGPSGCGKSTLLYLLAALDTPTSGSVRVSGRDLRSLRDLAAYRRNEIGLVFQLHNLLPHLSALQNVEVPMLGTHRSRRERTEAARHLLADVDLLGQEARKPTQLSGGERQRVAIARALANDPRLVLADEPTGNLDAESVARVLDLFRRLRSARPELTVVMVTHDPTVAAAADRTIWMRDGRIRDEVPTRPALAIGAVDHGQGV